MSPSATMHLQRLTPSLKARPPGCPSLSPRRSPAKQFPGPPRLTSVAALPLSNGAVASRRVGRATASATIATGTSMYGPENANTTSTAAKPIPAALRARPSSRRTPAAVAAT